MTRNQFITQPNFEALKTWYLSEYPFLLKTRNAIILAGPLLLPKTFSESELSFPQSHEYLKEFYISDYSKRNLNPDETFMQDYEFLLSYFIANYPLKDVYDTPERPVGNTQLGYFIEAIPKGLAKTGEQIVSSVSGVFDFIKTPLIIAIIVFSLVFFFLKYKKGN
jgi:hypothetical protein